VLKEARRLQPNSPNPALYTNLVYRERANTGLGDDAKNADLGMANAYFIIASNMGKPEKAADVEKNKAYAAANVDKADAIVKAAAAKIPPLPPVGVIAPEFLSQVLPPEKPAPPPPNNSDDGAKPDGSK
jgi:hypothetical protein